MTAPQFMPIWVNIWVILLPALALWLPSGYSYSAIILLLTALLQLKKVSNIKSFHQTQILSIIFFIMALGCIINGYRSSYLISEYNAAIRYIGACFILWLLMQYKPSIHGIIYGIGFGAFAAGCHAIWFGLLYPQLGYSRGSVYNNPIQFGNIALCLGVISAWGAVLLPGCSRLIRLCLTVGALFGITASLISQSRGGWLALLIAVPIFMGLILTFYRFPKAYLRLIVLSALLFFSSFYLFFGGLLTQRIELADQEWQTFSFKNNSETSVGARLHMWKFGLTEAQKSLLVGVGSKQMLIDKERFVISHHLSKSMLSYVHLHNEYLDTLVKKGIFGLTTLLAFFLYPAYLFWPKHSDSPLQKLCKLSGLSTVLLFMGYALTQATFQHNDGLLIYTLLIIFFYTALLRYSTP